MLRQLLLLAVLCLGLVGCRQQIPAKKEFDHKEFDRLVAQGDELVMLCFQTQDMRFAYEQVKRLEQDFTMFVGKLNEEERNQREVRALRNGINGLKTNVLVSMGSRFPQSPNFLDGLSKATDNFWRARGASDSIIDEIHSKVNAKSQDPVPR